MSDCNFKRKLWNVSSQIKLIGFFFQRLAGSGPFFILYCENRSLLKYVTLGRIHLH